MYTIRFRFFIVFILYRLFQNISILCHLLFYCFAKNLNDFFSKALQPKNSELVPSKHTQNYYCLAAKLYTSQKMRKQSWLPRSEWGESSIFEEKVPTQLAVAAACLQIYQDGHHKRQHQKRIVFFSVNFYCICTVCGVCEYFNIFLEFVFHQLMCDRLLYTSRIST